MTVPKSLVCPYMHSPEPSAIKAFRKVNKWTQDDLGRVVGVTGCAVNTWERGAAKMKIGLWELAHIKSRVMCERIKKLASG